MRHRLIKDVFTIIYKGRQKVGFEVEGLEKYIYLSPGNVKQCTNVAINEVEIFIGSTIRPDFYKEGEKMINGQVCKEKLLIIKEFWIDCKSSIEEMRRVNTHKMKPLEEIKNVFKFTRNDKDVIGFDTGKEKATFINSSRLQKLTLLNPDEFHILEGSFVNPEYYEKGEPLKLGGICNKSGILLKALNLRYFGKVEEMHERFENSDSAYSMSNYNNYDDEYDSSDWLADAAGSDDIDLMSAAYWNMD